MLVFQRVCMTPHQHLWNIRDTPWPGRWNELCTWGELKQPTLIEKEIGNPSSQYSWGFNMVWLCLV